MKINCVCLAIAAVLLVIADGSRDCLFIHGVADGHVRRPYLKRTFPEYWGNIHERMGSCRSVSFVRYDSLRNGWDNEEIHDYVCSVAAAGNSRLIKNKIIFAHSMGNLLLGAALLTGKCKFDNSSSLWYATNSPWRGSKVADVLADVCRDVPFLLSEIFQLLRFCDGKEITPSYDTLRTDYESPLGIDFDDLIKFSETLISGALCGSSAVGMQLNAVESMGLHSFQKLAGLEKPNDGVVSFESCRANWPKERFGNSFKYSFYLTRANHIEGACRHGEKDVCMPWGGNCLDAKPCSWYPSHASYV